MYEMHTISFFEAVDLVELVSKKELITLHLH